MRKLSLALICLAVTLGLACKKEEMTTAQALRSAAAPCQLDGTTGKTVCTITLVQQGEVCSVYPDYLHMKSGSKVIWDASGLESANAVSFKEIGTTTLTFPGGKPKDIGKGKKHDAGFVTGGELQAYKYEVAFLGASRRICGVDPVICIKTGNTQDTCN